MALEDDPEQQEYAPKKKKSDEEYEKRKKNITPGSLMKAMIRSGAGTRKPVEGDQVIFHCTIRTLDGVTVNSTRLEHGGKGYPNRYVLGRSKMLLGLCEGIPTMLKGEVAVVSSFIANFLVKRFYYIKKLLPQFFFFIIFFSCISNSTFLDASRLFIDVNHFSMSMSLLKFKYFS